MRFIRIYLIAFQYYLLGLVKNLITIPTACTKSGHVHTIEHIKFLMTEIYGIFFIYSFIFLVEGIWFAFSLKYFARGMLTGLEFLLLKICNICLMYFSHTSHNILLFLSRETFIFKIYYTGPLSFMSKDMLSYFFNLSIFKECFLLTSISLTYIERII